MIHSSSYPPAPRGRRLAVLRLASVLQFLGALPPLVVFLVCITSGESLFALNWSCAPLALGVAVPLWLRQRWAWWASLLLAGWYPLAPLLELASVNDTLHGDEPFFLLVSGGGLLAALTLAALLWLGRSALEPPTALG
jgi:hypothetical protein